ncbi:MAG: hypothetical protein IKN37_00855 [Bacteroidales bacterium]|nr:hypothetical protein [Bacteroidales bacterium]MBR6918869.1 hypothetical protein [Bacteroidales bacterium]
MRRPAIRQATSLRSSFWRGERQYHFRNFFKSTSGNGMFSNAFFCFSQALK